MEVDTHASSMPRWLEKLLAREGRGARGSSKHARGRQKPRNHRKLLRTERKHRRAERRKHRFG